MGTLILEKMQKNIIKERERIPDRLEFYKSIGPGLRERSPGAKKFKYKQALI